MKPAVIAVCYTLFSAVHLVSSFAQSSLWQPHRQELQRGRGRRRNSVLYQSSIATPTNPQQQQQQQQNDNYASLKGRDIQQELKSLGVSYHDCFDRESLINRLVEARDRSKHGVNARGSVYTPSSAVASETVTVDAPTIVDAGAKQAELRSKTLKDLKLECSRRNIRYGKFLEKEDFVQAVWRDIQTAMAFSATGLVRPGAVTDVTGEQLDEEMNSAAHNAKSMILVDVYATWCGPCRMVVPQLEAASKELDSKVRVVKLDSDKNHAWAGRYQVQGLPTMLLIKDGRVIDRLEGAHPSNRIVEFVTKHMA